MRGSKTPLLGFICSSKAKVKILPHYVYRIFEGIYYTQFSEENRQTIGKSKLRMHNLHPFFKYFLEKTPTPPPPPTMRGSKTPLLGFICSFKAKVKILPHHVYRSFEGKYYTQFLGRKSTGNRQKVS